MMFSITMEGKKELILLTIISFACVISSTIKVRIGVLLPFEPVNLVQDPCFPVWMVKPALDYSIEKINKKRFFNNQKVKFMATYMDSKCSDVTAPLAAMHLHLKKALVSTFFGPCCKYALSPIGRYNIQWGLPILTPGGSSSAFGNKKEYHLLTRIVNTDLGVQRAIITLFSKYKWKHLFVLFHDNVLPETKSLGHSACNYMMQTLRMYVEYNKRHGYELNGLPFDDHNLDRFNWSETFGNLRNSSRGK